MPDGGQQRLREKQEPVAGKRIAAHGLLTQDETQSIVFWWKGLEGQFTYWHTNWLFPLNESVEM